jgi:hypothetical protein
MVQLELSPEVEQQLIATARAKGLEPAAYASQLIASSVGLTSEKHLTKLDVDEFLTGMASLGKDLPPLSEYAMTRESFYEDHD